MRTTRVVSADTDIFDDVCGGGGGGVSNFVGGSWGVMGTGIDSRLGNGDIGCRCCCCQPGRGKNRSVGGWVVV